MSENVLSCIPDYLTHYFENARGPFRSLSDLSAKEAEELQREFWRDGRVFASKRDRTYLRIRRELERLVRDLFIQRGGRPTRANPFTMVLGSCNWFYGWYIDTQEVRIPIKEFPPDAMSFTYGDVFPAMRYQDGKPHRGRVYVLDELEGLVEQYGLPQVTNPEGKLGPDRYIEAQIWTDDPIEEYIRQVRPGRVG